MNQSFIGAELIHFYQLKMIPKDSCEKTARSMLVSLAILCNILSFTGNVALFSTILKSSSLHTNLNLLVLGVTAADILSVLILQPMDIAYFIKFPAEAFTTAGKIIWESFYYSYLTVSAYSLCAINLERFFAIHYPLRYNSLITRKVILSTILACWLYGVITFALVTYLQYTGTSSNCKVTSISMISNEWLLSLFITNVFFPGFISFMASVYITRVTWKHKRQISGLNWSLALSAPPSSSNISRSSDGTSSAKEPPATNQRAIRPPAIPSRTSQRNIRRTHKMATLKTSRLILCLSLTFLACTLPYIVTEIHRRFSVHHSLCDRPCSSEVKRMVLWWISYWNSVINVFCYVILNKELRTALKRNLLGIKTRLF